MRCCASLFALLLLAAQLTVELTAAAETRSKVDLQAEEERILAQHFPNKDDADADYDEDEELSDNDDDADDENYDDDAHFDANRFGAGGGAAETHPQPPTFLEQPAAAFCTRTQPATLRCSAAHAVQLHIVCSGHQRPPQLVQDEHVDPQSGAHVQQVIATVSAAMVLGHQQAGGGSGGLQTPLRCDCHAVSPGGKARSHPPATVELAYLKKQFALQPVSMRVHEGNRTEFQCAAPKAQPPATVQWLHNGQPVRLNDSASAARLASNSSLIITTAALKDAGNYTCVARNIAGSQTSAPAQLIVYVNGGWTPWTTWHECQACPGQRSTGRMRTRSCTNPVPLNGGAVCSGSAAMQSKDCRNSASSSCVEEIVRLPSAANVGDDNVASTSLPFWTQWSEWEACSPECIQVRRRSCTDAARRQRRDCAGREFQTQPCQSDRCTTAAAAVDGMSPSWGWMLFLGLGVVCGACLTAGAALTHCNRKHAARRLPSYRLTPTGADDLQLTESSKQGMTLSDWRQHQYCAVV